MSYDEQRIGDQIDGGLHQQKAEWDNMTLQLAKDQAAQKHGYTDFDEFMYLGVTGDAMDDINAIYETAMERYAEAKAKEANETIEMLRHSLAQATANRIFEKENIEKEAYNQGVRDAAESVELHTPTTAPPKIGKWHSLPINKQSILKLLK